MEQSSLKHVKGTLLPFSEYCLCLPIDALEVVFSLIATYLL